MDFVINFLTNTFQNHVWLATLIVSMCPTLESKIALLAMNSDFWGSQALSPVLALLIAWLGSLLPCLIMLPLLKKLKGKIEGFWVSRFLDKYTAKSNQIENKTNNFKKYLALTGFVALPLPLTGVWAGSIIAGLSNLKTKYCFLSIAIGALISSSVITILCTLLSNSITYILIFSILIVIIFLVLDFLISMLKEIQKSKMSK